MVMLRRLVLWIALLCVPGFGPTLAQDEPDPPWRLTLLRAGDPGTPFELRGRVLDPDQRPVAGATVSVRHADAGGSYSVHAGEMTTNERGEYWLRTVYPGNYGRPHHIHMSVAHPAHQPAFTEVLFKGDPNLGGQDPPNAIVVEEVRLGERTVLVGNFDVVLSR